MISVTRRTLWCVGQTEPTDITPTIDPEYQRGRFVIHVGDEQTFLELKDLSNQIRCQGYCPAPMLGLDVLLRSS